MRATQMVSFQSDDGRLEAFLAHPEGDGPFPGVVVFHEVFGLNDQSRSYDPETSEDSWRRTLTFFREHIG